MNETEKQIVEILEKLRPYLQRDGGDVEYVKFEDGIVYVQMLGACVGCASMDSTLKDGIEQILLEEVPGVIGVENIEEYLGKKKFSDDLVSKEDQVGTVNGLAWTSVGGTMLPIEVSVLDGTGKIELTGNLGDVMKESAKTAVSYIRSKASEYGIDEDFYKNKDIHIHAPEAAVPKDGPSAGLAITTAIVSELTGIAIKSNVAMTGEISLKGKALAIGGLKEKSMAAYKAGCDTVIIPQDNKKDLDEISDEVKQVIDFISVKNFDEVLPIALVSRPIKKKEVKENIIVTDKTSKTNVVTQ